MSRRTAAPFHQLSDESVLAGPWTCKLNGTAQSALDEILTEWDYGASLSLERKVTVDWTRAATDLAFEGPFDLLLLIEIGSGRGTFPRQVIQMERLRLLHGASEQIVSVTPACCRLSHQLSLRSWLVLERAGKPLDVLAPLPGARLWGDRTATRLEGDDPRFPMEVVSFAEHFAGRPHRFAPWFVSWSPAGAHRDFRGALRLYLNKDQPEILERVQAQDTALLQAIMGDVASQVCEGLLRQPDHEGDLREPEEGSLADQVRHWLHRAFQDVDEARSVLEQRPGEFRAALLASMRL